MLLVGGLEVCTGICTLAVTDDVGCSAAVVVAAVVVVAAAVAAVVFLMLPTTPEDCRRGTMFGIYTRPLLVYICSNQ